MRVFRWILLLCIPVLFWQCDKDDDVTSGQLRIEITDGPADDQNVKGVFVTVAEVYVDGALWSGFSGKQSFDLMTLQNGTVRSLGIAEVDAKTYNRISLVLDMQQDASGNSPGCYVLTQDDAKHTLATSASATQTLEVVSSGFQVTNSGTSTVVVDFDLRKALRYGNSSSSTSDYAFGTHAEMQAALRLVDKQTAGHISGQCTDLISGSEKIVVYAYTKGNYDREKEVSAPADKQFANAITSAAVNTQGNYTLSWLPPGDYELVFASYKDDGNNGTMDLQGTLTLSTIAGIDLSSVSVGTSATVTINVVVLGILPL